MSGASIIRRWKTQLIKIKDPRRASLCGIFVKSVLLVSLIAMKSDRICNRKVRPQSRKGNILRINSNSQ